MVSMQQTNPCLKKLLEVTPLYCPKVMPLMYDISQCIYNVIALCCGCACILHVPSFSIYTPCIICALTIASRNIVIVVITIIVANQSY